MIREGASLRILKYKSNKLHAMPIILRDALQMAAILFFLLSGTANHVLK
jgi:hypothetical protein